jgi:hypothetical protein
LWAPRISNGNDIETQAERSFALVFVFESSKRSEICLFRKFESLFIPQIRKIKAERTLFIPQIGKIEAKRSLFIPQIRKIKAERTRLILEIGKIEAKKTGSKFVFVLHVMEPRNRFQVTNSEPEPEPVFVNV